MLRRLSGGTHARFISTSSSARRTNYFDRECPGRALALLTYFPLSVHRPPPSLEAVCCRVTPLLWRLRHAFSPHFPLCRPRFFASLLGCIQGARPLPRLCVQRLYAVLSDRLFAGARAGRLTVHSLHLPTEIAASLPSSPSNYYRVPTARGPPAAHAALTRRSTAHPLLLRHACGCGVLVRPRPSTSAGLFPTHPPGSRDKGFGGLPAAHRVTLFGWYPRDAACASRLGNASSRYAGYEARKPAGLFPLPLPSPSLFYDTTHLL